MQGQGQEYGQKHGTKELVEFHNHLHALIMVLLQVFRDFFVLFTLYNTGELS